MKSSSSQSPGSTRMKANAQAGTTICGMRQRSVFFFIIVLMLCQGMQVLLLNSLWSSKLQPPSVPDTPQNIGRAPRNTYSDASAASTSEQQKKVAVVPPIGIASDNTDQSDIASARVKPGEPLLDSAHKATEAFKTFTEAVALADEKVNQMPGS